MSRFCELLCTGILVGCSSAQPPDISETSQGQTTSRAVIFLPLYGYPAVQGGATASFDAGEGMVDIGGGAWDVPISLPTGRTFTSVAGAAYDWTGATVSVQLLSTQRGQLGSATTAGSRNGAAPYTLSLTCSPCSYLSGEDLFLRFTPSDAATSVTHEIDPITVTMAAVVIEGGGPHMGNLPLSRTITLNPGDPVPSALLNEIQDNIVAGFFGSRTIVMPARQGSPGNSASVWNGSPGAVSSGEGVQGQSLEWWYPFVLPIGATITAVSCRCKDSASPQKIRVSLMESTDGSASGVPYTSVTSGTPVAGGIIQSAGSGVAQTLSAIYNKVTTAGNTYGVWATVDTFVPAQQMHHFWCSLTYSFGP